MYAYVGQSATLCVYSLLRSSTLLKNRATRRRLCLATLPARHRLYVAVHWMVSSVLSRFAKVTKASKRNNKYAWDRRCSGSRQSRTGCSRTRVPEAHLGAGSTSVPDRLFPPHRDHVAAPGVVLVARGAHNTDVNIPKPTYCKASA